MEKQRKELFYSKIAEVQLSYKPLVKLSTLPVIRSSEDMYKLIKNLWDENKLQYVEQFKLLLLNRANKLFGIMDVSTGGVTGTVADPKVIFAAALKSNACSIIIAHNHPSGNLKPSSADEALTQKIKHAAEFFDIKLLDHLIITAEGYYSFTDEGLI